MNVELLLEVVDDLLKGESIYPIKKNLDVVVSALSQLSSSPQDQTAQQQLASSLVDLEGHLKDRMSDLDPKSLDRLEEIGGLQFYTPTMAREIMTAIAQNALSPSVALKLAQDYQSARGEFVVAVQQAHESLNAFGFLPNSIESGTAEIGFQIPRDIFHNEFDEFIKELSVTKFIINTASLLKTGEASSIKLGQISSSDPLLIFGLDPKVIAMVGGFVTWALHTWKQAEEIKALRAKASELPDMDDIAAELDKRVEASIDTAIRKKAEELAAENKKKTDKELVGRTERSLRMMIERVERGYTVHLRLPEWSLDDENDEINLDEELYTLREELLFPETDHDPILKLSAPLDDE